MDVDHEMLDFDDNSMSVGEECADFMNSPQSNQEYSQPHFLDDESTELAFNRNLRDSQDDMRAANSEASEESDDGKDYENPNCEMIHRLEQVVGSVISQISDALAHHSASEALGCKISFELVDRRKPLRPDGTFGTRIISFPHKSRHASAKSLAQFLRVIDLMHEALCNQTPTTKRDMYYKDVTLFGSQATVDKLVDDVAATMSVSRSDLCVRASAKGLFCGSSLTLHLHGGDIVRGNNSESALIPPSEDIKRFEVDEHLAWVLVVEKEAVFQTLCQLNFVRHTALPGPGLIITGKGYPDVATRQLVANLGRNLNTRVPILAIVDSDPYGIDIASVYKYGSSSMSYQEDLDTPRLRWAGVMASELAALGISKDGLIPVTKHDEKKAFSMLKKSYLPQKWRKEIQYMLHNRRKAEIEALSSAASHIDSAQLGAESNAQDCILARYLIDKIIKAVDSVAAKATD